MRGLKYLYNHKQVLRVLVAPLAGAWIEISLIAFNWASIDVAPLAGAWIEIISFSG
ncbi:hypothetical protein HMPREF1864_01587 [Peptoniphilus sp. DNF00840]|nr:hypothetical protein HMPREF1864_01587 [Peptoniphilus sp. DNF00840]